MRGGKLGRWVFLPLAIASILNASEYRGQVSFNGLPVPGVLLTATQSDHVETQTTDERGIYSFPDLPDGQWTLDIDMTGFAHIKQTVPIASATPPGKWELRMLSAGEILR